MMKKVVITGATGMIGIHLIQIFIQHDIYVYAIVHKGSPKIKNIPKHSLVKIIECDLDKIGTLTLKIKEQCDAFYHLAWAGTFGESRNDLASQIDNIKFSLETVKVANQLGCKIYIGAGSQAEYGRVMVPLNENVPCFPENGYGIAKFCVGKMTNLECQKYGIRHNWVRILSVYGPLDGEKTLISTVINKLLKGEVVNVSKGEQIWDYLYCEDCAQALYLIGEKGKPNTTYCLGSGNAKPLKEYIEIIKEIVNPCGIINYGAVPYSEKQVMYLVADIMNLQKDVGFEPKTNFREGIRKTLNFYDRRVKNE